MRDGAKQGRRVGCFGKACLGFGAVVVLWLLFQVIRFMVAWITSGAPPKDYATPERQNQKLEAFSLDTPDPASYWGEYSAAMGIEHKKFDTIMFNPRPDMLPGGFVALGMRHGKIVCSYVKARRIDKISVNGRVYAWTRESPASGPSVAEVADVARSLSDKEFDDLRALSELLLDTQTIVKLRNGSRYQYLPSFAPKLFKDDIGMISKARLTLTLGGPPKSPVERNTDSENSAGTDSLHSTPSLRGP